MTSPSPPPPRRPSRASHTRGGYTKPTHATAGGPHDTVPHEHRLDAPRPRPLCIHRPRTPDPRQELISKYGFSDILFDGITRYDPSRVASQIVSGIGFLGAGIILTRHGAIRGLTTAATIWETAAIGMACGAGLWWLALAGTVLHFIVIALLTPLVQFILMRTHGHKVTLTVHYTPGHGVLSTLLGQVSSLGWNVSGVSTRTDSSERATTARFTATTRQDLSRSLLVTTLADLDGVAGVDISEDDDE